MTPVLVDSNVLLDVATDDPVWGDWSSSILAQTADEAILVINPLIYAEVSIGFSSIEALEEGLPPDLYHRADLPYEAAFLAVWRTASRFMPERGKASTWILTLVHRRAVDAVRREQRRRADSLELAAEPAVEGAEEDAFLRLQRERVQAALRHLPDAQREALELAYYGGFSQSELAERLGQPLGTIKSRMFGGLSRLRDLLGEPGTEMSWTSTS